MREHTVESVTAKAKQIVVDVMDKGISPTTGEKLKPDTTFTDLQADSLDQIDIIMALEDEFEIEISDREGNELQTFGAIVDLLKRKLVI